MINITPIGPRILIERIKPEEKKGSLILTVSSQEKKNEGIIIAIGKIEDCYSSLKVGDKIMFSPYAGMPILNDEKELIMIDCKEIIAVLSPVI